MNQSKPRLALDVGEKRIGVAVSDGIVTIARPLETVRVDGDEMNAILQAAAREKVQEIIIGYPRSQSGDPTAQTAFVESFKEQLSVLTQIPIVFQDESLTSILAEERLKVIGKPYEKGDIDAEAARLILQDYLEKHDGRF